MRRLTFAFVLAAVLASQAVHASAPEDGDRWTRKAERPGNTVFQRTAYEQLARMRFCEFRIDMHPGTIQILSWKKDSQTPTDVLYRMGLDVLPIVAEALDDETPTLTITHNDWGGKKKHWKVNEIVAMLITYIADRDFAIGQFPGDVRLRSVGEHPEMAHQFQQQVQDWYSENRKRTLAQRKIADVESTVLQNRLKAIEWIGANRASDGKGALIKRITDILNGKERNSSLDAELASSAYSLGRIGDHDAGGLLSVSAVCTYLSDTDYIRHSSQIYYIFQAYHGYALLGRKKEAIEGLEALYKKLSGHMDESSKAEYQKDLKTASDWD